MQPPTADTAITTLSITTISNGITASFAGSAATFVWMTGGVVAMMPVLLHVQDQPQQHPIKESSEMSKCQLRPRLSFALNW